MKIIGRTPWAEWDDTEQVSWYYFPEPEESITVEQDNIKGGKKPIDLRPAHKPITQWKTPSCFDKQSLVEIRRQNFEVVE